jgi:cyclohexyl-isocyanide hydratase
VDKFVNRRAFFDIMGKGAAAAAILGLNGCVAEVGEGEEAGEEPATGSTDEALLLDPLVKHIAMVVYPGFTLLDLIGPHTCFAALGMKIHLVWKTRAPITSDMGVTILPTTTFADCPKQVEILFVPGSSNNTAAMIRDRELRCFLKARGEKATWVTSVCTGSLILGAAGLLRGYKATSHWATRDLLPLLDAEQVDERYVVDRNRITGAGVTSGIDFGLRIVEQLKGTTAAQVTQLMIEYAPEPPLSAGDPASAPPSVVATVQALWALMLVDTRLAAETAPLGC